MDWAWWERIRGARAGCEPCLMGPARGKDPSASWREDRAPEAENLSFYIPPTQLPPPTKPLAKEIDWGSLIAPRIPPPPASHALAAEPEGPSRSHTPLFRQQQPRLAEEAPAAARALPQTNFAVPQQHRDCPLSRSCQAPDCAYTHRFGREVIDTALETLIKCGVLRACEVQPNTAPSPSQPKSNPSLPRPSAAPGPADACSFFSGALSGSCPPCAAPLPFGQCDVEEVHNSVLDLCVKLLSSSSGGEASVWFMGEVYKRMPQARDEIAAFGGLKSFCAAHPDVLVYKTGTEDKDRVCLSPRFQYLVTKSPSPTQQTSPNSLSSPTAKGCRYGRYCARIYCKFKHTKDRDAPGLREGFLEMCTRHLKDQGGSDLSSNLMNAIYREEPKAKDEIARLVRKWGGLKGFCNEVPECLVYVHDEEGSRHRVTLLQRE